MPTYEYKCSDCDHEFELFQSMNDKPLKQCPECNGSIERLIGTGGGLIFKGSGFYITDYRNDSYNKAKNADKPSRSGKDSSKKTDKNSAKKVSTTKK